MFVSTTIITQVATIAKQQVHTKSNCVQTNLNTIDKATALIRVQFRKRKISLQKLTKKIHLKIFD